MVLKVNNWPVWERLEVFKSQSNLVLFYLCQNLSNIGLPLSNFLTILLFHYWLKHALTYQFSIFNNSHWNVSSQYRDTRLEYPDLGEKFSLFLTNFDFRDYQKTQNRSKCNLVYPFNSHGIFCHNLKGPKVGFSKYRRQTWWWSSPSS